MKGKSVEEHKAILLGNKFGRLTVLSHIGKTKGCQQWSCICECGKMVVRDTMTFKRDHSSLSCGCQRIERVIKAKTSHGNYNSGAYISYRKMMDRCLNPKNNTFHSYGAKGITVCQRWIDGFKFFLEDMGPRPDGCSIDRIDNSGNYEPSNCRWADISTQASNKTNNRFIIVNGVRATMAEQCRKYELNPMLVIYRVRKGMTYEEAFEDLYKKKQAA